MAKSPSPGQRPGERQAGQSQTGPLSPPALEAKFLVSATEPAHFPEPNGLEVIMMGRSNCGKSTLINRWLGRKSLAKTSATPGRTRLLNFFSVVWAPGFAPMTVVDLPGYGYAAAPKAMVRSWEAMVGDYLTAPRPNRLGLILLDIRRAPAREEKDLSRWLASLDIPHQIVATKADKISRSRQSVALALLAKELGGLGPPLAFSATSGQGREELIALVNARQTPPEPTPDTDSEATESQPDADQPK
ncbi:MAG: ribosome biogenesis GTP-binding protein YihA/YsxC [Deltaproteobacteria bacterium]|jgi:GTP-binding protein|nr:ribosome biogenesis GTP-binding protein YihA/YsxC [Deltaproteobacteria bacterium]